MSLTFYDHAYIVCVEKGKGIVEKAKTHILIKFEYGKCSKISNKMS